MFIAFSARTKIKVFNEISSNASSSLYKSWLSGRLRISNTKAKKQPHRCDGIIAHRASSRTTRSVVVVSAGSSRRRRRRRRRRLSPTCASPSGRISSRLLLLLLRVLREEERQQKRKVQTLDFSTFTRRCVFSESEDLKLRSSRAFTRRDRWTL